MSSEDPLFFIAWVAGEPVQSEVTGLKREAEAVFDTCHALKAPAHITMLPPFHGDDNVLAIVDKELHRICSKESEFTIVLDGVDVFRPRVIFIAVKENNSLATLYHTVVQTLLPVVTGGRKKRIARPFHPHVTIANRDFEESTFYAAYDYFKDLEYRREAMVASLSLLKHSGRTWDTWKEFPFHGEAYVDV